MTPNRLRDPSRAAKALKALSSLRTVAGNHGRFLFDFSPAAVVFRITDDPAPRLLYCFGSHDDGKTLEAPELLRRVKAGDIVGSELVIGGQIADSPTGQELAALGASVHEGVKAATTETLQKLGSSVA